MTKLENHINKNLNTYYKMVYPKWYYTKIDNELVKLLFKEYSNELQIDATYPNYNETIINLYEYSVGKVTRFFRDMHVYATSKVSNVYFNVDEEKEEESTFKTIIKSLSITIFVKQLITEKWQVRHLTEIFKRGLGSMRRGNMLRYDAVLDSKTRPKHADADGITRPATDDIWKTLNTYLGEFNCRCRVVEVQNTKRTDNSTIRKKNFKPVKTDGLVKYDKDPKVLVFIDDSKVFKDYDIIRRKYPKK